MKKEDILSDEFRRCCHKNVGKRKIEKSIHQLGYTIEDFVDLVISRSWIRVKDNAYAISTIACHQVSWTLIELRKKIPYCTSLDHITSKEKADSFSDMLSAKKLSDVERTVLKLRYLFDFTLAEVGSEIGKSGERARQIQEMALEKLRND